MKIDGVVGRIEHGYFPAAVVEGYTVTHEKNGPWELQARVVQHDAYNLKFLRPLLFVAPTKKRTWRWTILLREGELIQIVNGKVRARLGPPIP